MRIDLTVPAETIACMMVSAIESGDPVTHGWCEGIYLLNKAEKRVTTFSEPWYADAERFELPFILEIEEITDENLYNPEASVAQNRKSGALVKHRVTEASFKKGFEIMAYKFPKQFGQVMTQNTDTPCADIFLQCVLFGEEKYA